MRIETLTDKTEFIVDQDYLLKHNANLRKIKEALETDLKDKERVILQPPTDPKLNPLYSDVRSHVSLQAVLNGFLLCPVGNYEKRKVRLSLGNRLIEEKDGYRFR